MASSEGSREIEAAKKRLAAAEARAAADAKMAEMARQNAQASAQEVQEARKCLKEAEARWEVIDIDADDEEGSVGGERSKKRRKVSLSPESNSAARADDETVELGEPMIFKKRICDDGRWGSYVGWLNANDRRHGKGKMTYDDGDVYDGQWNNDKAEGRGTYRSRHDVYDGQWQNDMRNGRGTIQNTNGDIYVGQWKDNKKEGQGLFRWENTDVYRGRWKNNLQDGQGTFRYANGSVFEGQFKNGKRDGQGTFQYANGVYEGQWRDGKQEGLGTYSWLNGEVEMKQYKANGPFGEGVRWSKDRKTAWLLKDGDTERKISLNKAKEVAAQLGFDGVPPALEE